MEKNFNLNRCYNRLNVETKNGGYFIHLKKMIKLWKKLQIILNHIKK